MRLDFTSFSCGDVIIGGSIIPLFFGYDPDSVGYFQMALLASLFFSLFTILSTMLQSLNHHRFAIRLTVEAIILKVIFQVIGLGLVGGYGMSLSNGLAFGSSLFVVITLCAKNTE